MKKTGFASSLAIRLTAALVVVTFLTTTSVLAGIYYLSVHLPMKGVRAGISREAASLQALYINSGEQALREELVVRRRTPASNRAFDALVDRDGTLLTGNFPSWPRARRGDWVTIEADLYRDGDEDDHEALSRDILLADGRRLLVGRDIEVFADRQELMGEAAMWSSIAVILFGALGGFLISWITGRRLEAVRNTAHSIMEGDLTVRVPVKRNRDEFDQLGLTLNAMLDRNMELMASVARVSDNIAHELRTPLARLRAALDAGDADGGVGRAEVSVARAEADRLQQIFNALLGIARLNTGRYRIGSDKIHLDALIADAVDYYTPEVEAKNQSLTSSLVPCAVSGDRNLIFQAVANLIDNAVKFTPAGSELRIALVIDQRSAKLEILDDGPGVDEASHSRLAERFFRAPGSEEKPGTGLGLALVDAIAKAHGGSLSFEQPPRGFAAVLHLPLAS